MESTLNLSRLHICRVFCASTAHRATLIWLRKISSILLGAALASCYAQKPSPPPAQKNSISPMQRHYESAYRLQEQGDLVHADEEHIAFLVNALESVGTGYANAAIDAVDPAKALELIQPILAPGATALTRIQKVQAQKVVAEALYAQG